jgi:hypothetical protein
MRAHILYSNYKLIHCSQPDTPNLECNERQNPCGRITLEPRHRSPLQSPYRARHKGGLPPVSSYPSVPSWPSWHILVPPYLSQVPGSCQRIDIQRVYSNLHLCRSSGRLSKQRDHRPSSHRRSSHSCSPRHRNPSPVATSTRVDWPYVPWSKICYGAVVQQVKDSDIGESLQQGESGRKMLRRCSLAVGGQRRSSFVKES